MAIGFGVAFTMPAATMAAVQTAPKNRVGTASGTFATSRQMGSFIGVACLGALISSFHSLTMGIEASLFCASLLFLLGILLAIKLK